MTKKKNKSSNQMSLFDWIRQIEQSKQNSPSMGSLDIDSELRAALSEDIKACPLSRHQIAARMSDLIGQEITKFMLDNWTAEAHEKHRFPSQYLPAFAIVTGGRRAFEVLSHHAGLYALPGPEALRAEIQRWHEVEKNAAKERRKREFFLKEVERGK